MSVATRSGAKSTKKTLTPKERDELLETLRDRFEKHMEHHDGIEWSTVRARLAGMPENLWALGEMERTGGEPDVVGKDEKTGEYIIFDCSVESPKGRGSECYDPEALASRNEHKANDSAVGMATAMRVDLLTEEEYRRLQKLGEFDTKTSSWLQTPQDIRRLGGAIFGDRRYKTVFVYHNGAESYYAARGFRCSLKV